MTCELALSLFGQVDLASTARDELEQQHPVVDGEEEGEDRFVDRVGDEDVDLGTGRRERIPLRAATELRANSSISSVRLSASSIRAQAEIVA